MEKDQHQTRSDKHNIAETAHKACNLPANKNGPDLNKGGKKKTDGGMSDFA